PPDYPGREPAPPPAPRPALARRPASAPGRPEKPADGAVAPPEDAPEWRQRAAALMRGREWAEAQRVVESAVAAGDVTPDAAAFLLEVCSTATARELWRLRRALRRGAGDETPLGGALDTARLLLDCGPAAGLPAAARGPAGRRLWRGHTRLGLRRWRAGDFDAAVGTLFQALAVPGLDDRRRALARDLLVRTLEDMAGQRLELIPQPLGDGDRAAALEQAQRLLAHVRRAREEGIAAEDLAVAAARARQLLEHIEHTPVR
ncbi:MAG TPA: hypothetical protein VFZ82_08180, partial [Methylomirabilota bacterium]|nr:hypothetical protein [Methylomirabilota bacterium]